MNDYQTIVDIVDTSIRNSSYISVIISSCVFIIYTFINRIIDYFKSKDNNKPMIEMINTIKGINDNVTKLNNGLDKYFQDNTKKEVVRCKSIIELSFLGFKTNIESLCRDIIIHNNIDENKEYIVANISKTVSSEYYKIHSALSLYDVNNSNIASHLKDAWIEDVVSHLINIIYNKQGKEERISQAFSYLKISANEYSTYVYNKTFN